jgi:hypothetical protein
MQVVLKWIAQVLLLPLIKELAAWVIDYYRTKRENRRLKEENKKKGEAYENASNSSDARGTFNKLP